MSKKVSPEEVMANIIDDINKHHLRAGDALKMHDLRARYSCGLAPLREALNRLHGMGIVNYVSMKGFSVASMSLANFNDLYDCRIRLVPLLVERIMENNSAEFKSALMGKHLLVNETFKDVTLFDVDMVDQWEKYNWIYYKYFYSACPSKVIKKIFHDINKLVSPYRHALYYILNNSDVEAIVKAYMSYQKALSQAVLNDDVEKATRCYINILKLPLQYAKKYPKFFVR